MHGSNDEAHQTVRPRAAVIAAFAAVLVAAGLAGCTGQASPATSAHSASPAAAPAPLSWSAARAPLPADTDKVAGQDAVLDGVSCPAAGNCVIVGYDKASGPGGDVTQGLAETLSHGTWTPVAVPAVSSQKGVALLSAVSCPEPGVCVAVGFVASPTEATFPVIETLSGGRWDPVKPPLPADASTTGSSTLNDISCPAAGACVATGWYTDQSGLHDGFIAALADGTWTATRSPLPGNADPESNSTTAVTYLAAVTCTAADACVAAGQYRDTSGQVQALIDTLSGGTWTAASAPLPGDAAAAGQVAGLWATACAATGTCVAAGHYIARGGQPRYLTETLSGGAWTAGTVALPADAAADQKWAQNEATSLIGLACESAGYCVATAEYLTKGNTFVPLLETLSGGTWTAAKAPLPADVASGSGQGSSGLGSYAYLELDACPAPGSCVTVGSYPAADGTDEGLIDTAAPAKA